jgi:hypothetical protein
MAVDGDIVAVTGTDKLSIVSAVVTEPLKLLAQQTLPEPGYGAAIVKDKVLVVVGDSPGYEYGVARLLIFDIKTRPPRQAGAIDMAISQVWSSNHWPDLDPERL